MRIKTSISSSKSLVNRALILQFLHPELEVVFETTARDVLCLQKSLQLLKEPQEKSSPLVFDVGEGGTTVRFLSVLLSTLPGEYELKATPRLIERAYKDLKQVLQQLGAILAVTPNGFRLSAKGWPSSLKVIEVPTETTSQILTALALVATKVSSTHPELELEFQGELATESYFKMTCALLESLGFGIKSKARTQVSWLASKADTRVCSFRVFPAEQKLEGEYFCEPDWSNLSTLLAFAARFGEGEFAPIFPESLQPDCRGLNWLQDSGLVAIWQEQQLVTLKSKNFRALHLNFTETPDLFPMMAVFLALAQGTSKFTGLRVLKFKESNRLHKTLELLTLAGIKTSYNEDADELLIFGAPKIIEEWSQAKTKVFDCDQDHRMAFAAAFFKKAGLPLQIVGSECVDKSFPNFFKLVEVEP